MDFRLDRGGTYKFICRGPTLSAGILVGRILTPEVGRRWWRGQLEYGFEVVPVVMQSRPQLVYGGGFEPVVLRWNSPWTIRGMQPYTELAGGGLRTTANLPSGDTSVFNFIAKGGGGLYIPVAKDHLMDFGLRWSHISNANLGRRNPEFNGIETRIAYHGRR
jgi:Lipid A 3-O-deacylase (PagL)